MSQRIVVLLSVVLLAGCATGASLQQIGPDRSTWPAGARDVMDDRWRGWQVATPDPGSTSCLADPKSGPEVVTVDFDGDGHPDLAAAIQTSQGVRLVALQARADGYALFDLDAMGDQHAAGYLSVERRGAKFFNPRTNLDDYFDTDTLVADACGKDRTAYFWTGSGFVKVVLPKGK